MKKKNLKYLLILISLILLITVYEITNISNKVINRGFIDIDINNARNPQIKKILDFLTERILHY